MGGDNMKTSVLGLAIAIAFAAPTAAQERGVTYNCDTAADHYSELTFPTESSFRATGKVRLLSMAKSEEYATIARLVVTNDQDVPGPSHEGWAGFTFLNMAGLEDPVPGLLLATQREKGAKAEEETFGIASDDEVSFELSYDGKQVDLQVDGHSATMPFTAHTPALRIVCSTGSFLIHDLVIEQRP